MQSYDLFLGPVGAVDDREAKLGDDLALGGQLAGDSLARKNTTNTGGGTSQNHVSLLQFHNSRDVLDQCGDSVVVVKSDRVSELRSIIVLLAKETKKKVWPRTNKWVHLLVKMTYQHPSQIGQSSFFLIPHTLRTTKITNN